MALHGSQSGDSSLPADRRLYVPYAEGWKAAIKSSWDNEYCFSKNAGEDFFHPLMCGEIYVQRGDEKYCLSCALKHRIVTTDRIYWQRRDAHPPPSISPEDE